MAGDDTDSYSDSDSNPYSLSLPPVRAALDSAFDPQSCLVTKTPGDSDSDTLTQCSLHTYMGPACPDSGIRIRRREDIVSREERMLELGFSATPS